ncbi:hypothetical protein A8924_3785 [Saccharopolyspora erythraea NRRL 2338]|uniref:Uncharacterized protein n=2 Tax=Saccharopolyspora erythraea TaxID=1836 RepID=A4FF42_SACEN|nr:hypothetical protein [Saccharopolyspora erythraea]EQD82484.1 hypothetical protein N599_30385 [Saccharopolyspora erythraea D]PFG96392.1 hypothetical protein A8924_3785 [Saccharopolyspora erythraea NRRL 2338]QRK92897.1 hypothetical protein JQX30_17355 [Saccharopolyspora erythraea]CAM02667.1 hypothetical protein SACE_3392 [Saccharopolyspora erythraea NRRL 2338]
MDTANATGRADELVQDLTAVVRTGVEVDDPGAMLEDRGDDQRLRREALAGVRAALAVEGLVSEAALRGVEVAVADAVWLGASLADLSAVTGRSRQAARKRWPALGGIYRRRKWLANHVDDTFYMVRLLLDRSDGLAPGEPEQFRTAVRELREALTRSEADFDSESDFDDNAARSAGRPPAARWRALDELVDVHLRRVIALAGEPANPDAGFALHGAGGVLGYYHHATTGTGEQE